ncbi:Inositol 2-dehydrogenase/D-chiro-inositol 3-dehydrogenase [subsurface metagenome]
MITVGLIGAGYIGPIHLGALARLGGVRVKTVIDVNGELAKKAAAAYNVPNSGTDHREVIKDPEIDVIHNCTPNKYHYQITKEAMEAGKQVLSEKPLAMDLKEAEELVELAEKKRAVTGIDFCYRYYPVVQEMAVQVRRGDAGAVRMVSGSYFQDWLSREIDWTWRLLRSESGESNITADLGSHWFDLIQFVTGLKVREVIGDLATLIPVRKRPTRQVLAFEKVEEVESEEVEVELEDYSSILFRLSGGAPGSFTTSQVCAGRKSDTEFQIYGSECSYAWNHKEATVMWIGHREKANEILIENPTLQDPSTAAYASLPAGHPLGYHDAVMNLFKDYYEAVDKGGKGRELRPTFQTGFEEMKILEAILASHEKRSWVEVKD